MYNHRSEATRFDCLDLDPYGSAVPFLDAAIGAVADGGELLHLVSFEGHELNFCIALRRTHVHHLHRHGGPRRSQLPREMVRSSSLADPSSLAHIALSQLHSLRRSLRQCRVLARGRSSSRPQLARYDGCQIRSPHRAYAFALHRLLRSTVHPGQHQSERGQGATHVSYLLLHLCRA